MNHTSKLTVRVDPDESAEIKGSALELEHLAALFREASDTIAVVDVISVGRTPVDAIAVRRVSTMAMIQIRYSDRALRVEGAKENLGILADNVSYAASAGCDGSHIHIEHYDEHPYLDAQSLPLIISRDP